MIGVWIRRGLLVLVLGSGLLALIWLRMDARLTPPGEMIEVEPGRRLHVVCRGTAIETAPSVLYDAGAFGIYADAWRIMEAVGEFAHICAYDRAGLGFSDPVDAAPSPTFHAADMERLLDRLGASGPIVLVGHSMAGLRLHAFAATRGERLAGLVFLDAASAAFADTERGRRLLRVFRSATQFGGLLARIGALRLAAPVLPDPLGLQGVHRAAKLRALGRVGHHKTALRELKAVEFDDPTLRDTAWADRIAFHAVVAGGGGGYYRALAEGRPQSDFAIAPGADHVSLLAPPHNQGIIAAIRRLRANPSTADKSS
ncbi:MAG: alpha/beta fold hydrolase [Maricaulaceae bacterium]